jgi:ATP-dependent exoDNAse (exonuclease V) beta subunit
VFDARQMATEATRKLNVAWTRAKQKLIVIAHRQHLHDAIPQNVQDPVKRQRLLCDLVEWAARAGYTHAQEFLDSDLPAEGQA